VHCKALVPSFGVPAPSGSLPDLTINADAVLDITNCAALDVRLTIGPTTTAVPASQIAVVSQSAPGASPICVVKYGAIAIIDPFILTVTGGASPGHVLSLQGTGDITVAGKINFFFGNASGPSPGASVSTTGTNSNNKYKAAGAGGGGGAFAGGKGGTCAGCSGGSDVPGGLGGPALTFPNTLFSGSRGGNVVMGSTTIASGGAGGGGLHLVSLTRVTFAASAVINLNAEGGGGPSEPPANAGTLTAGGGGSGGMLVVEAPTLNVSTGAIAAANGGGGAGGGTNQAGTPPFSYNAHAFGQNGQLAATRAAGGDITATIFYGDGGPEADGTASPSADGQSSDIGAANYGGGAGGGSRGFIVLRGRSAANVMVAFGAVISPAPMLGAVTAQ
jgi:hypothetical protein